MNNDETIALWVTYINIVLYALCFQLQRPVEPFLIQSLVEKTKENDSNNNHSTFVDTNVLQTYGTLQSLFSVIQTIGSPLVGWLLDRAGIRTVSALVFLSSALCYFCVAMAASTKNMTLLFLSKIPTCFQHAFLVAQATAAVTTTTTTTTTATETLSNDSSTSTSDNLQARASALSRMTTAYTIGATIGPFLGGLVAQDGNYGVGAQLAVVGSLLSVVLSLGYLPSTTPLQANTMAATTTSSDTSDKDENDKNGKDTCSPSTMPRSSSWYQSVIPILAKAWHLLLVKFISGVANSMHQTIVPLIVAQHLQWEPSQLGVLYSSSMFAVALLGAFGLTRITQAIGPLGMIRYGFVFSAVMGCTFAWVVTNGMRQNQQNNNNTTIGSSFWWFLERFVASNNDTFTNETTGLDRILFAQIVATSIVNGLSAHMVATGLTTQSTGSVQRDEQGTLLGLEHGLFSLARIIGPKLGTMLLQLEHSKNDTDDATNSTIFGLWTVELVCAFIQVSLLTFLVFVSTKESPSTKALEKLE